MTGIPFEFSLVQDNKVLLFTDMRFDQLDKLTAARLEIIDGQQMLVIDESRDRWDSGQNPECLSK